jgi:UDP-GlcNAc:undecaprenyl-phosphate/decaprenyl-phosphate GlcNAc-1-phosphate transferase
MPSLYATGLGILASAFFLSLAFSYISRWLSHRVGAIDEPKGGRKIHTKPTPLLGGLGIGATIILFVLLGSHFGWFMDRQLESVQLVGFVLAILILMVGGLLDDRFDLSPRFQILFLCAASFAVVGTGTTIELVTNWQSGGGFSLVWQTWTWPTVGLAISFPADLLAVAWLVFVTVAVKFFDGLDGLVSGQTVIGAGLIAALALSPAYYQPAVALLALIVAGSFLGFLPFNLHPAKQFLGESGSTIAGFSLAFLAILGGAKVATALMALGLPLADASLVVFGRLVRGASPFRGDDTHLHFKLLKAGLSQRATVAILWFIALLFGVAAFGVQSKGKVLLFAALAALTALLSYFAGVMKRSRIPRP